MFKSFSYQISPTKINAITYPTEMQVATYIDEINREKRKKTAKVKKPASESRKRVLPSSYVKSRVNSSQLQFLNSNEIELTANRQKEFSRVI